MTTAAWVFRMCMEELETGTRDTGLKHAAGLQSQFSYLGHVPIPWRVITLPIN